MDSPLDLGRLADALKLAFPSLEDLGGLTPLATGASSVVVESQNGYVFRLGRSAESPRSYRKEARLLPVVESQVDLPVPVPRWYSEPTSGIQFGVIGYRKLPGVPLGPGHLDTLDWRRIARQIGEFAFQLHQLPVDSVRQVELPPFHSQPSALSDLWSRASRFARRAFAPAEYGQMEAWIEAVLEDHRMQDYRPCLVHGDLSCWNTLVDEDRSTVSGIVDFENACIGDPAMDLLRSLALGQEFFEVTVAAYVQAGGELGGHFEHRVRNLRVLRRLFGFVFFAETNNVVAFADSTRKLRESDMFPHPPSD